MSNYHRRSAGSILETLRLQLIPYASRDWLALIEGDDQFQDSFGIGAAPGLRAFFQSDEVSPDWLAKLNTPAEPNPWLFGFAVVHREHNLVIGNLGFVGPPDEKGTVEIAYAIVSDFQGQGYATEATMAGIAFAFSSDRVQLVIAHTLPIDGPSPRVLTRCGFKKIGEIVDPVDGPVWRWELTREFL